MSWAANTEPVANTEDYSNPQWSPNGDLIATFVDSESIHILNTDFSIEYEIINELTDTYFSRLLWLPTEIPFLHFGRTQVITNPHVDIRCTYFQT